VKFLIDWILANKPSARILEVGCFDGTVGIHVLRSCPGVHYTAIDTMQAALDAFAKRAEEEGLADRLELQLGSDHDLDKLSGFFDVIVFYEIIEHVPDPWKSLQGLREYLDTDGRLFVSTPWGAYDRGRPYNLDKRDPRGHIRAMTARELFDAVEDGGFQVETMNGANGVSGATLHLMAKRSGLVRDQISFFVPSALWDWNATKLIETGMGASEETIVYLARELAQGPSSVSVSVYGPVPEDLPCVSEEVRERVGYWTRAKVADAETGTMIVSRSPSSGRLIDPEGRHDKILWLQDTIYPDLNEGTAKDYRKIVVLSVWHKEVIAEQVGKEADRLVVIPNFILAEHFKSENAPKREPHHFIYASSPDRGLVRLLKMWPAIRSSIPDATLDIFYGWEGCMKLGTGNTPGWTKYYRKVRTEFATLQYQPGVTSRGRVNQNFAREFQRASVWAYPTAFARLDVSPQCGSCGWLHSVTTPYAALIETAACPEAFVNMRGVGTEIRPNARSLRGLSK
jgi:SAM-dependent methyltransferase